jgi:hypothetical protein
MGDPEYFSTCNNLALAPQQQQHNTLEQMNASGEHNNRDSYHRARTSSSPCFASTSIAGSSPTGLFCNNTPTNPTTLKR